MLVKVRLGCLVTYLHIVKFGLPNIDCIMLHTIHKNLEERLSVIVSMISDWCDMFAIMAVLAVGVGLHLYGFSMEKQLFWPISCTCLTKHRHG